MPLTDDQSMSRPPISDQPPPQEPSSVRRALATLLYGLDRLPWTWLLLLTAWLAIAPITPEPHLIEKLRMLAQGTLVRPVDIFDLALHATPLLIVALKLWRQWRTPRL